MLNHVLHHAVFPLTCVEHKYLMVYDTYNTRTLAVVDQWQNVRMRLAFKHHDHINQILTFIFYISHVATSVTGLKSS